MSTVDHSRGGGQRARDCGRAGRDECGAAAVEFALVLPLLILLVFGIVQFGIAYNRQQGLHAAAREGARLGSLPMSTNTEIEDRVTAALAGVALDGDPTITITGGPDPDQPCHNAPIGQKVVVRVQAATVLDIPLWGSESITITGRGEFRCE